jgi:hypothetical protein
METILAHFDHLTPEKGAPQAGLRGPLCPGPNALGFPCFGLDQLLVCVTESLGHTQAQ